MLSEETIREITDWRGAKYVGKYFEKQQTKYVFCYLGFDESGKSLYLYRVLEIDRNDTEHDIIMKLQEIPMQKEEPDIDIDPLGRAVMSVYKMIELKKKYDALDAYNTEVTYIQYRFAQIGLRLEYDDSTQFSWINVIGE